MTEKIGQDLHLKQEVDAKENEFLTGPLARGPLRSSDEEGKEGEVYISNLIINLLYLVCLLLLSLYL